MASKKLTAESAEGAEKTLYVFLFSVLSPYSVVGCFLNLVLRALGGEIFFELIYMG
jgi:hypothetical protein